MRAVVRPRRPRRCPFRVWRAASALCQRAPLAARGHTRVPAHLPFRQQRLEPAAHRARAQALADRRDSPERRTGSRSQRGRGRRRGRGRAVVRGALFEHRRDGRAPPPRASRQPHTNALGAGVTRSGQAAVAARRRPWSHFAGGRGRRALGGRSEGGGGGGEGGFGGGEARV